MENRCLLFGVAESFERSAGNYADNFQLESCVGVYFVCKSRIISDSTFFHISFFREKIRSRQTPVRSYYFDMLLLSKYWKCLPEDERFYHHTISPTLLYGLREAIAIFIEKGGLESSWKRHKKASHLLYKKLECNGFRMLLEDIECRVPSVTSVIVPQDINPVIVANYAMEKYKLEIAGGLGSLTGRIFRIGLLGDNATEVLVEKTVKILAESTNAARKQRKVEQHFSATAKLWEFDG